VPKTLRALGILLRLGLQADARQMTVCFGTTLLGQVAGLVLAYAAKLLVDAVVHRSLTAALVAAVVSGTAGVIASLCERTYITLAFALAEQTNQLLDRELMRLVAGVPTLEHHERPEYIREVSLLRLQLERISRTIHAAVVNFRVWIQLVGSALLLARLHPLLVTLPLFGLGSLLAGRKAYQWQEQTREATEEPARLQRQLFRITSSAASAKEVRVFGLADELIGRHQALMRQIEGASHRTAWRAAALNVLGALVFAVGYVGAIAFVLVRAVSGLATPGDVVLAVGLAAQMNGTVSSIVSMGEYLRQTTRAALRYLWLREYASQARAAVQVPAAEQVVVPDTLCRGIDLVGVSFRYPGTDPAAPPILSDVTLSLPAGKVVALVGENGAGKSTIVKLLSRFYEPSAGEILVDGVLLRRFAIEEWRARLSASFQEYFAQFQLLARETVGVGDLPRMRDQTAVERAIDRGGATDVLAALPSGLDTQLGKGWPGGVELSGGQWQKLALARAVMREAPLVILFDEPTAALDAHTEHALFERMAAAAHSGEARGTVTLVVSHRFSTVRMADLIVVIDKGRVLESGSHTELMERNGLYAELYGLQARAYR
jgi:ABC-type multidrug transport system fused ATPase/permease subunit